MEKATILFFADSHLGFDYPIRPRVIKPRRGEDFFNNFHLILNTARKKKVDLVIHGGDVFFRSKVHPKIVSKTYDAIFELADSGIPIVIVPGNHDRSKLPPSLFLHHSNIYTFWENDLFSFNLKGRRLHVGGFSFVKYIGKEITTHLNMICKKIPSDNDISLLCIHQAIEGATVGPSDYMFRPGPEVIRKQDLTGPFSAILSGHIHRHQILWKHSKRDLTPLPIIYPGSIERTSFAERKEEKGFVILEFNDTKTPDINFIPLPSRPMYEIYFPNLELGNKLVAYNITKEIESMEKNAIIRIKTNDEQPRSWFTQKWIENLVPPGVSVQLSIPWYRDRKME